MLIILYIVLIFALNIAFENINVCTKYNNIDYRYLKVNDIFKLKKLTKIVIICLNI